MTKAIIIAAALTISGILLPNVARPHTMLQSPNGGEEFQSGDIAQIQWRVTIPHGTRWWQLWYSVHSDRGPWVQIDSLPPGDTTFYSLHTYNWQVPDSVSDSVRILVFQRNYNYFDHYDTSDADFQIVKDLPTNVDDDVLGNSLTTLPRSFALHQNWPNPFNPDTKISFELPERSQVRLTVYNVLGQTVRNLYDGRLSAGVHTITWDGTQDNGSVAPSGIYFYQLRAGEFVKSRKALLLK